MNEKIEKIEFKLPIDEIDQPKEIVEYLKGYAKKPFGFLLFAGKNGTGKSFAARALVKSTNYDVRIDANPEFQSPFVKFINQAELNLLWTETMSKWGSTRFLLNQLIYIKLLAVDDVGTRVPSEAFMDFLYALMDARYENRHEYGTIITTNLNSTDMRSKFSDAFVSRVSSGKCFRFDGKDRRIPQF